MSSASPDADIAKAHNAADLLDLLIAKIGKITDPAERVQIADAFGIESALPLLSKTRSEIQGMSDDFAKNARVISGEQAEAIEKQNAALERAHVLMHDQIRSDLLNLAPLVSNLGLVWEGVEHEFLDGLELIDGGFRRLQAVGERRRKLQGAPPAAGCWASSSRALNRLQGTSTTSCCIR